MAVIYKWFKDESFQLKQKEVLYIIILTLLSAFILSPFRKLGVVEIDLVDAALQVFEYIAIFLFLYLLFILPQKAYATYKGFEAEFEIWRFSPVTSIIITFMTWGALPFIYMGHVAFNPIRKLRMRYFETNVNFGNLYTSAVLGCLTLLLLVVLILEPLYFLLGWDLLRNMIIASSAIIAYSMLPLPYSTGINMLMYNKTIWIITFVFAITSIILILAFNIYSYLLALILAIMASYVVKKSIK